MDHFASIIKNAQYSEDTTALIGLEGIQCSQVLGRESIEFKQNTFKEVFRDASLLLVAGGGYLSSHIKQLYGGVFVGVDTHFIIIKVLWDGRVNLWSIHRADGKNLTANNIADLLVRVVRFT